jgi:amino acid adenylation domain-containing protein
MTAMLDDDQTPPVDFGDVGVEHLSRTDFNASLPAVLEPRMEAFADRVAVAGPDGDVTYRELNQQANRITHWIQRHHAAEDGAIVLLLEQGASFLAGALAALKSGRVYVPLDGDQPVQRNRDIVRDAEATLCLTDSQNEQRARDFAPDGCRIVTVDEAETGQPGHNLGLDFPADAEVAVYYTSGSTGTPKGVVHTHRTYLYRACRTAQIYRMTPVDRFLFIRRVNVNAGVRMMLSTLLSGATLCPWDLKSKGTAGLFDWLDVPGVTICPMPVNIFRRAMADVPDDREFPSLRYGLLTSERVYPSDVERWMRHFPNCETLIHHVACNEAGTYARYVIDRSTVLPDGPLPVGYPTNDIELMLWDEDGNDVAPGQAGEVVLKGRYHAKGYWKRPDLTAQAFLPVAGSSDRIYRTGDLGVMDDDGCLRLAGRNDDRVRILGNRVEISAVEGALLGLDGIDEVAAVVETHGEDGQHDRLAAYYVSHGEAPSTSDIRAKLSKTLLRSMIPTKLVRLDALPRTPSAKLDFRALAACKASDDSTSPPENGPRDELERMLVDLLEDLLDISPIAIDDDIIALGADSLTSIEVVVAIETKMGVSLPVDVIWSGASTAAELADIVRGSKSAADPAPASAPPGRRNGFRVPTKVIDKYDLVTPALLLMLNSADRLRGGQRTRDTMRAIARLATSVRRQSTRNKMSALGRVLGDRTVDLPHRDLVTENLGTLFEEILLRYRGWPDGADAPTVTLEGREHIDRALAEGKGLILWRAPMLIDSMAIKVALNAAGLPFTVLGRAQHGLSLTKVGHLGINRLTREREGPLTAGHIVIERDEQPALAEVQQLLGQNGIVSISARFLSDNPVELPFFDGRIVIATGPPRLALATGAALIPIFSSRDESGHFRVTVHPAVEADSATGHTAATRLLMERFIASLETHVLRNPATWPNWRENVPGRNTPAD